MPIFEYEFGVFVRAENADEAWEKVREVSEKLDEIDYESDSSTELVNEYTDEQFRIKFDPSLPK